MDFQEVVLQRYSVRAYRPDPIDGNVLAKVLEAARLAPTAANRQPVRLQVIQTAGRQADLGRIYRKGWFVEAPVILGVYAVPLEGWIRRDGKNHAEIDAAIVMDHAILAAADLGLGTCWVCNFDVEAARDVLRLPEGVEPVAFTPLGWPADQPKAKLRRPLAELLLDSEG